MQHSKRVSAQQIPPPSPASIAEADRVKRRNQRSRRSPVRPVRVGGTFDRRDSASERSEPRTHAQWARFMQPGPTKGTA